MSNKVAKFFDRLFTAKDAAKSLHWNYDCDTPGCWVAIHKLTDEVEASLAEHIDALGEAFLSEGGRQLPAGSSGDPAVVTDVEGVVDALKPLLTSAEDLLNDGATSTALRNALEDFVQDLQVKIWLLSGGKPK